MQKVSSLMGTCNSAQLRLQCSVKLATKVLVFETKKVSKIL